ncbi:hypothetical protein [Microbulbifer sp. SAOS-129_SWC]|uniref:hypothetical protein n=1 Tax=Microbulbifer sp. SAOS-129_SWC TaxID=3145235 RepID=UPI0032179510
MITWTDNSDDETGFYLQRKVGDQGNFGIIAQLDKNITKFVDDSVISGKTYSYRVFSTRDGESSDSYTEVSITIANTGREDTYAKAYQLADDQKLSIYRVIPLDAGDAIVVGNANEVDTFVSRIDVNGVPKWTRYIESEDSGEGYFTAWLQSSDALYIIGQIRPNPETSVPANLGAGRLILDPETGEILEGSYLKLADIQLFDLRPADENNDGVYDSLLLVTRNFADADYFVVKTDLDLNVQWSKEITKLDALGGKITAAPDGSVFFAAQIREPDYQGDRYLYLAKFDVAGNLVFQRNLTFGADVPEISLYSMNILLTGDAADSYRLILSGIAAFDPSADFPANSDTWFLALNGSGDAAWKKRITTTDLFLNTAYQGSDQSILLRGSADTSAYYGSINVKGDLGPAYSVDNDIEIDLDSEAGLAGGSKLFELETNRFDPHYVGIIAKVDADNNIPRLANGLVAEPMAIDTLDFLANYQAESFSVVDWSVGSPIAVQKRNHAVQLVITDLVGK